MTINQTDTTQALSRELLDTLIDRWQEVADAYQAKADNLDDDLTRRYTDYRHIYLRNIRDLRHLLDTGRMPCSLMNNDERRRGDCGRNHADEHDKHGQAAPETAPANDPWTARHTATYSEANSDTKKQPTTGPWWGPGVTAEQAALSVVSLHIAQAFIQSNNEEVHLWARELAHELKRELFDLSGDIGRHLLRMTLQQPALSDHVPF
ncbi:hypothetical protein [Streptomyces sp. bgisy022]|uniref:hypothetical protein n=1 Tax=Streptomyces sp. bgisy022 TaxID=3413769 RepID=UPI003D71F3F8